MSFLRGFRCFRLNVSFRIYRTLFSDKYSQLLAIKETDEGKKFMEKYHENIKNIDTIDTESTLYLNRLTHSIAKEHPEKYKPILNYLSIIPGFLVGNSITTPLTVPIIFVTFQKAVPIIGGSILFYLLPMIGLSKDYLISGALLYQICVMPCLCAASMIGVSVASVVPFYRVTSYYQSVNILLEEFKKNDQ